MKLTEAQRRELIVDVLLDNLADISGWRGAYRERFRRQAKPLVEEAIGRAALEQESTNER